MKKKKMKLFYKIYFSAIIVFAVIIFISAIALNVFLTDYNKGIHETVSAEFFENNFVNVNAENLISLSNIKISEYETRDDMKAYLETLLKESNLSYTSISTGTDSTEKKYIVKSDAYKIASFTLLPDSKDDYYVNSLVFYLPDTYKKEYTILSGSTLFINGFEVKDTYISEKKPHESAKYLPENVTAPELITYTIPNLTKEPEVYIIDRNGVTTDFLYQDGIYMENIVYDEMDEEIVDRLLKGAKQYAICMQDDASKASVYPYFEQGTDLYNSIRTAENMFVWDHSGYAFEDVKVSEYFRYDENTVSLRIAFVHTLQKYGSEDYRDITDITYFARNINGKYMIFARYNN